MRKRSWMVWLGLALLLAGCSSTKPLGDLAIPYQESERFTYDFLVDGQKLTDVIFSVKEDQYDQQTAWLMRMELELSDQGEINEVWTSTTTLQPLYSRIQLKAGQGDYDIRTRYQGKKIHLEADTPQGMQQVERNSGGVIYDNAQLLMTLRALPLREGYQTKLGFVQTKNVSRGEMNIKVVGSEKVRVPAGEFECFRVEMSIQGIKQTCWYGTDSGRWLIKYDNGQSQFEMASVNGAGN